MSNVYVFRGSPSSGKGTITEAFIKELRGKVAYIELDKFRWGFHLLNRSIPEISEDEHHLAYKNYLSVLENYLKNGAYTIVTEGLFSWDTDGPHGNTQDIIKLCQKHNRTYFPILLFADKEILWERNGQREYSVPKEEFDGLYDFVMQKCSDDETAIDVGAMSVDESVQKILSLGS